MCVLNSSGCGCSGSPQPTWRTVQPANSSSSSLGPRQSQARHQLRTLRSGRRLNQDPNGKNEVCISTHWAAVGSGSDGLLLV
jgi:hypothetical protein